MNTFKSACILCDSNCGIELEIEGREITKIKPDKSHLARQGYFCQKAGRLNYYQNHNQRLTHPLKRMPDGSFEKIDWDTAAKEIATKLIKIRDEHGGHSFAYFGGGGQGNHLQGMNGGSLRKTMGSRYVYSSLAQEKTGDFWIAGKIFGRQDSHVTADGLEHADLAIFWGCNPWMAHGFPHARNVLNDLSKSDRRKMVVIDPKRTKSAEMADLHIAVRPGRDAFLLSALIALLIKIDGIDTNFIGKWTTGWEKVADRFLKINIESYCDYADVPLSELQTVAEWIKATDKITFRHDLGLEQSLHSTLNCYLEKLLIIATGSFGREGTNTFHSTMVPVIGQSSPEADGSYKFETKVTKMIPIAGIYPPNILAKEIDSDHPERVRALWVNSSNPVTSVADTKALKEAIGKLELLVTVDVAMTETARLSHYVLPAASQFEKWEASSFNFGFPSNYFHLRKPVFEPTGEALSESEIYERILLAMGETIPLLSEEKYPMLERKVRLALYPLYMLARRFASANKEAVIGAGHEKGDHESLGDALFAKILEGPVKFSEHKYEDNFSSKWLKHEDGKFHLEIELLLNQLDDLQTELADNNESPDTMILMAGERRAYTANVIYRNPDWRRSDAEGSLQIHSEDASKYGLENGGKAICKSDYGQIEVSVEFDDSCRRGMCSLPNGYGLLYQKEGDDKEKIYGPYLNQLTGADHCDEFAKTPFHKNIKVKLEPA